LVSECQRLLAKLTAELLPVVAEDALELLLLLFGVQPVTDALDMDELHGAYALARGDEWVPAEVVVCFFF